MLAASGWVGGFPNEQMWWEIEAGAVLVGHRYQGPAKSRALIQNIRAVTWKIAPRQPEEGALKPWAGSLVRFLTQKCAN
jgi:hypothetical protein